MPRAYHANPSADCTAFALVLARVCAVTLSVIAPWDTGHAFEWLMQAGELRLWLQDSWGGQWDTLGMEALTRDYVSVLSSQEYIKNGE